MTGEPSTSPGWGHFRIEVPNSHVRAYAGSSWGRLAEFMSRRTKETGCEIWGTPQVDRDATVFDGSAPSDVVTVLQAAARGDDLSVVLDLFDPRPTEQSDEQVEP